MKNILILGNLNAEFHRAKLCDSFFSDHSEKYNLFYGVSFFSTLVRLFNCNIPRNTIIFIPAENAFKIYQAVILKFLFKKTIICDYYYSLSIYLEDRNINNVYRKFIYYVVDFLILKFSVVITISEYELIQTAKFLKLKMPNNWHELPLSTFDFTGSGEGRKKSKFCVGFWGSYVPLQGINNILDAFNLECLKDYDLILILNKTSYPVGYFDNLENLNNNIILYDFDSFENDSWLELIKSKCSLILGIFGDSYKTDIVIPNKVIDGIGLKIPVLTKDTSSVNFYFKNRVNIFTTDGAPVDIANSIIEISKMEEDFLNNITENAYEIWQTRHNKSVFNDKFNSILSTY
jgi:hypothetical protein